MRVSVRLFAALREQAGVRERTSTAGRGHGGDVWSLLELGEEPSGLLYALNKAYVERAATLADGDELAVIPPVSAGRSGSRRSRCRSTGRREVASDDAGAIATFIGTTRAHSRGREVVRLEYEAYEGMAEQAMAEIADELKARYELLEVAIHHRVGVVEIGGTSVVIAVSAAHRQMRWPRAGTQSTSSRYGCRSGRRRSTRAARRGSAARPGIRPSSRAMPRSHDLANSGRAARRHDRYFAKPS